MIVDVGTRAVLPAIPGLEAVPCLDSTTVMAMRDLPAHLVILGGGYIGCGFGQMLRRFRSKATIVDHDVHLLGHADARCRLSLEGGFRA